MRKRILTLILCLALLAGVLPAMNAASAQTYDYTSLDCTDWGANYQYAPYMNQAMAYYIENNSSLQTALNKGQTIVFAFEGGSRNASPRYNDGTTPVRIAALLLVVKLVDGTPQVIFSNDESNTFPDVPTEYSSTYVSLLGSPYSTYKCFDRGWGPGTLKDGIYPYTSTTYTGYTDTARTVNKALLLSDQYTRSIYVNPKNTAGYTEDASDGIYVHYRIRGELNTEPNTRRFSMGCLNVGQTLDASEGKDVNTFVGYCSSAGYVVVDRQLYKDEMIDIYSNNGNTKAKAAIAAITAWSSECAGAIVDEVPAHASLTCSAERVPVGSTITLTASAERADELRITVTGAQDGKTVVYRGSTVNLSSMVAGTYEATLEAGNASGWSEPVTVSFRFCPQGDVNDDGTVDLRDPSFLFRLVGGWEMEADEDALAFGEITGDGITDLKDVPALFRLVTGAVS